jgi:hypothetical protein
MGTYSNQISHTAVNVYWQNHSEKLLYPLELNSSLSNSTLRICPSKIHAHQTITRLLIAALFVIIKHFKLPKCPSFGYINCIGHITKYYTIIINEPLYNYTPHMNFMNITWSKTSQIQRVQTKLFHLYGCQA